MTWVPLCATYINSRDFAETFGFDENKLNILKNIEIGDSNKRGVVISLEKGCLLCLYVLVITYY